MKKLLLLILFTVSLTSYAQEKNEEDLSKSKTIEFSKKDGGLFERKTEPIGKSNSGGVEFKNIYITDVLTNQKVSALRLENSYSIGVGSSIDYVGTLDSDEIEACIKSLKYIKDNLLSTTPDLYTEIEYKSRDGVKIGAYYSKGWKLFIQTKSYTNKSISFIKSTDLDNLINLFSQSKEKMIK